MVFRQCGYVIVSCDSSVLVHFWPFSKIMGVLDVKQTGEHELTLEWDSSASHDMIADSTLALITGIDKSPASAKREYFL